ncbi:thymidine phosphorylase [Candidatus Pacearchaeota archaeon]|nr:thymidine phosphorylase [Candidatus Pacearchaeota archaeon]
MNNHQPKSVALISKKLHNQSLSKKEIETIINEIVSGSLSEAEIAYFIMAVKEKSLSLQETAYLTEAMWRSGVTLKWAQKVIADKHSIGGVAGNRTTPIVVAICAAAGLTLPKTSSRAITSAAGTADVMEVLAKVDFPSTTLQTIVKKANACLAWGGALGMAPADDKLIRVGRILDLDPEAQLIASILSKKLAAGSTHVLVDIPFGPEAKVTKQKALRLKKKFLALGKQFKLTMHVVLTPGSEPIGHGIGPILEARDVLAVLQQKDQPKDLEKKSLFLAAELLELTKKAKKGQGKTLAVSLLRSGKALQAFNKILDTQGRKNTKLQPAKHQHTIAAPRSGKIQHINNHDINHLARLLGCPETKSAGLYLYKHTQGKVKKGDPLLTLYATKPEKLKAAMAYYKKQQSK